MHQTKTNEGDIYRVTESNPQRPRGNGVNFSDRWKMMMTTTAAEEE
jgi:hypothetical protein